jgi:hypothetical protein
MPTFMITAPDGRKFRVTGPEGSTKEQALAQVQSKYQPQKSFQDRVADRMAADPQEYGPASPLSKSGVENFRAGMGKAFVDTYRGLQQLSQMNPLTRGAQRLFGFDPNAIDARLQKQIDDAKAIDTPLMNSGAGIAGNITGQVAQFAVPASGATKVAAGLTKVGQLTKAQRVLTAMASGGALANTQPVASGDSRLSATALGAAGGGAGEFGAMALGRAATGLSDKITPRVRELLEKAKGMGIGVRAEQATGSNPLASISAGLDAVPFSGRTAARMKQRAQFNRAVAQTFGETDDNLIDAVKRGEESLGAQYESVLKNNAVKADDALLTDLDSVLVEARGALADDQFGIIASNVDDVLGKVQKNGTIDANAAYNLKKRLDRIGRSPDTELAYHARELRSALFSALDRSLPEDVAKGFAKTREQYANLISVRKLLKAGADGDVTPARLATAKTSNQLRDVADVGGAFLKEPFGNSGTQNRLVGAGIVGALGGGAVFDPTLAMTAALGGATGGRSINALLASPRVVNYLTNGSPLLQNRIAPAANYLLAPTSTSFAVSQ